MKYTFIFLACLGSFFLQAQDLTGVWRGQFGSVNNRLMELMGTDDKYKFEVQLDHRDKRFNGVTYSYKSTVFYGKASARGTFNPTNKKVLLEELKLLEVRLASSSEACIMTCFLEYSKMGNEEYLQGTYTSMNLRDSSNCGRGTIYLKKVYQSDFYKEPFLVKREKEKELARKRQQEVVKQPSKPVTPPAPKPKITEEKTPEPEIITLPKNSLKDQNPDLAPELEKVKPPIAPSKIPEVLVNRENKLIKTIVTRYKEVTIKLFDNGVIDNDTVSVYLNKKLVISKQRLTAKPISFNFVLDTHLEYHELVLVAENLGEIPPNTSLMVVKFGDQTLEVFVSSNEQKNAVILFKYDKKE